MSANNNVILIGRLTKDVEARKTQSNLTVTSFTIACDRSFSRSQGDQSQQTADFINCVAWRQTAEFLAQYAKKGNLLGVEGRIQTRNYTGTDGKRVYVTEVVCDNVQLLTPKSDNQSDFDRQQKQADQGQRGLTEITPSARPRGGYNPTLNGEPINTEDSFDIYDDTLPSVKGDDLPFY